MMEYKKTSCNSQVWVYKSNLNKKNTSKYQVPLDKFLYIKYIFEMQEQEKVIEN